MRVWACRGRTTVGAEEMRLAYIGSADQAAYGVRVGVVAVVAIEPTRASSCIVGFARPSRRGQRAGIEVPTHGAEGGTGDSIFEHSLLARFETHVGHVGQRDR